LRNSERFRSLKSGGKTLPADLIAQSVQLFGCNANGQIFSTFGSSAFDDKTTVFASHSHQKAMGSFTRNVARLKCSFHVPYLWLFISRKGFLLIKTLSCQDIYYESTFSKGVICLEKWRRL
jgi:hypothetical protein